MTVASINAWIPVATALVSAGAVLLGTFLQSQQVRKVKILEIRAADKRESDQLRREAGEGVYKSLQKIAKSTRKSAEIYLKILDGKADPAAALKKINELTKFDEQVDTIQMRFTLETYFPEAHQEWMKFDKQIGKFIDLTGFVRENLDALRERYRGEEVPIPEYEQFRTLPINMQETMHAICTTIVKSFSIREQLEIN